MIQQALTLYTTFLPLKRFSWPWRFWSLAPSASSWALSWCTIRSGVTRATEFFSLPYLEACYLSLVFITRGLHAMLTRVTKGFSFSSIPLVVENDMILPRVHYYPLDWCQHHQNDWWQLAEHLQIVSSFQSLLQCLVALSKLLKDQFLVLEVLY